MLLKLFACATLLSATVPAAAVTLTFDSFAHNDPERLTGEYTGNYTIQSFVEQGFTVSIVPSPWIVWGRNDPRNADQGGATLTNIDGRARTAFERVDFAPFTLNSFDVASFYNGSQDESGFPTTLTVRFNGDITTDQVFTIDSRPGFQTLTFNRSNISAFEIRNSYVQLDNVVLNNSNFNAVPEPSSWALFIVGFGVIGRQLRDKQGRRLKFKSVAV